MTAEETILKAIQELHSEGDWVGYAGIYRKVPEIEPSLSREDVENAIIPLEIKAKSKQHMSVLDGVHVSG